MRRERFECEIPSPARVPVEVQEKRAEGKGGCVAGMADCVLVRSPARERATKRGKR